MPDQIYAENETTKVALFESVEYSVFLRRVSASNNFLERIYHVIQDSIRFIGVPSGNILEACKSSHFIMRLATTVIWNPLICVRDEVLS